MGANSETVFRERCSRSSSLDTMESGISIDAAGTDRREIGQLPVVIEGA